MHLPVTEVRFLLIPVIPNNRNLLYTFNEQAFVGRNGPFHLMSTHPPPYGRIFLKGDPKVVSEGSSLLASFDLCDFSEGQGGNLQISEGCFVSAL